MSEQDFRDARGELANSQRLVDEFRHGNEVPQPKEMMDEPIEEQSEEVIEEPTGDVVEETVTEQPEEKTIAKAVEDTLKPFLEKITNLISKKEEEPKEVEIKIEGEMTPKE